MPRGYFPIQSQAWTLWYTAPQIDELWPMSLRSIALFPFKMQGDEESNNIISRIVPVFWQEESGPKHILRLLWPMQGTGSPGKASTRSPKPLCL